MEILLINLILIKTKKYGQIMSDHIFLIIYNIQYLINIHLMRFIADFYIRYPDYVNKFNNKIYVNLCKIYKNIYQILRFKCFNVHV